MFSRIFDRGQRETTHTSVITEVWITVLHTIGAQAALVVAAWLFKLRVAYPFLRWFHEQTCKLACFPVETTNALGQFITKTAFTLAFILPPIALGVSFLIQIYDRNWSPPRGQLRSEFGPAAPVWLRRLIGWWDKPTELEPVEKEQRTWPTTVTHETEVTFVDEEKGGKQKRISKIKLDNDEWQGVRRSFIAGASISVRDLIDKGGMSQGTAKRVSRLLKEHEQRFTVKNQKWFPNESFKRWVLREGWRE